MPIKAGPMLALGMSGSTPRRAQRALSLDAPERAVPRRNGGLERSLRAGRRVVVVEARPPTGPDLEPLAQAAQMLSEHVDAIQLTDMPFATPHVANLAAGARLRMDGHEVVLNITCRDRNIIAQQGALLGAAALGINSVFCIRGDEPGVGDHPHATGVFETSGLELVRLAKRLRNDSSYLSGRSFTPAPALFVGAAFAPHATYGGGAREMARLKCEAGADFLVTQPLCDIETPAQIMSAVRDLGETFVLVGVGPVTTLETLEALQMSEEVYVPRQLADDLQNCRPEQRIEVGMRHALSVVESALGSGAHGILIYPFDSGLEQTIELARRIAARIDEYASHCSDS